MKKKAALKWQQAPIPDILTQFEAPQAEDANYKAELKKLTKQVADAIRCDDRKVVIAFEGMDAAG